MEKLYLVELGAVVTFDEKFKIISLEIEDDIPITTARLRKIAREIDKMVVKEQKKFYVDSIGE